MELENIFQGSFMTSAGNMINGNGHTVGRLNDRGEITDRYYNTVGRVGFNGRILDSYYRETDMYIDGR